MMRGGFIGSFSPNGAIIPKPSILENRPTEAIQFVKELRHTEYAYYYLCIMGFYQSPGGADGAPYGL